MGCGGLRAAEEPATADSDAELPFDDDSPYLGGWPVGDCRFELEATGSEPGEIVPNLVLTDQFGEALRLHDFCDRAVYVEYAAAWCPSCTKSAPELVAAYGELGVQGAMVITVLADDWDGEPATQDDLVAWAESFGIAFPVLADPHDASLELLMPELSDGEPFAIPASVLIEPGMILHSGPHADLDELVGLLP